MVDHETTVCLVDFHDIALPPKEKLNISSWFCITRIKIWFTL